MGGNTVHRGNGCDHRHLIFFAYLENNLRQGALMAAHNGMNLFLGNQTLCHSTGHIRISLGIAPDDLDGTAVNLSLIHI